MKTQGESHIKFEVKIETCCHEPRNAWGNQNLEEEKNGIAPKVSGGSAVWLILDFWPLEL